MAENTPPGPAAAPPTATAAPKGGEDIVDQIVREGRMARDELQLAHARDLVGEFANQVLDKSMVISPDLATMINNRIAQIDQVISDQLNEIMHAEAFQKLEGSWRGGGSVSFASGQKERAQCRAQYRRASGSSYTVTATCATPSGRATQTATLRQVGGNTYQGQFHNSEYDVSGTIFVTVSGNRQSIRLTGDAGSASIELRR